MYWAANMFYLMKVNCNLHHVQLCHRVVDGLCRQQPPSRAECNSTLTLEEWTELNNSLITLFRLAVHNNSSDEKVGQPQQEFQYTKPMMIVSYLATLSTLY